MEARAKLLGYRELGQGTKPLSGIGLKYLFLEERKKSNKLGNWVRYFD